MLIYKILIHYKMYNISRFLRKAKKIITWHHHVKDKTKLILKKTLNGPFLIALQILPTFVVSLKTLYC